MSFRRAVCGAISLCALAFAQRARADPFARSAAKALGDLHDRDPNRRANAAAALRAGGDPSPQTVGILFEIIRDERDADALGQMLVTVSVSGVEDIRPLLEAYRTSECDSLRENAREGMRIWRARNGPLRGPTLEQLSGMPASWYGPIRVVHFDQRSSAARSIGAGMLATGIAASIAGVFLTALSLVPPSHPEILRWSLPTIPAAGVVTAGGGLLFRYGSRWVAAGYAPQR